MNLNKKEEKFVGKKGGNGEDLIYRSEFLLNVFNHYIPQGLTVLEIGCGDCRNIDYLRKAGYNVDGIDKIYGTSIEDFPEKKYDVIFSMSTFFLIPPENNWVFEKIARMAQKYIITFEGETGDGYKLWGRNYTDVFKPFGFQELYYQTDIFNEYGVLRVLKK